MSKASCDKSVIGVVIGSLILLFPSLAYLIAQIVLTVKNNVHLEGNDLVFSILTYTALSVFILTGVIGIASIVDCFGSNNASISRKYLIGCAIHWFIWILLSIGAVIALIVVYSLHLETILQTPQPNNPQPNPSNGDQLDEYTKQKILVGTWIGVSGFILLCCLLPICCCGVSRMISVVKSTRHTMGEQGQYSRLSNDDL
ncbi:hypothetical protein FDP41_001833 [Naegleria fowleri]|uniref:Transmembrane protein n=1 Tax=Naegleria fowleri TaxID=5763 RepID=A0A6A5BL88_NAEFO|nr:uncharacterized protein FDP41_001833 [Naegleria fowleri]KAF0978763.1 hypothetical protein FDP41_001833 [Naegleria fowleri]CAG4711628.1 unnamed protein product [Naegleria fowleri]